MAQVTTRVRTIMSPNPSNTHVFSLSTLTFFLCRSKMRRFLSSARAAFKTLIKGDKMGVVCEDLV